MLFQKLMSEDPDMQKLDANALQRDYVNIKTEYEKIGRQIALNFFKIAKLIE